MDVQNPNSYVALLKRHEEISHLTWGVSVGMWTDEIREKTRCEILESVPPGIYEHFKSRVGDVKQYAVYGVGSLVDSVLFQVSYVALYKPHAGRMFFRQLVGAEGFLKPIKRGATPNGAEYEGPRFRLIEPLPIVQIASRVSTETLVHRR